eukprot:1154307-Pelagomonas_calceolata.AAC.1
MDESAGCNEEALGLSHCPPSRSELRLAPSQLTLKDSGSYKVHYFPGPADVIFLSSTHSRQQPPFCFIHT